MTDIIQKVAALVDTFKASADCELEGSLGTIQPTNFVTGVDFTHFEQLHKTFAARTELGESADIWRTTNTGSHYLLCYYNDDIRGQYVPGQPPVFTRKKRIHKLDITCSERPYDLRINLKREESVADYIVRDPPLYVRFVERWSFIYKQRWRYDFSKTVSGKTKEQASRAAPVLEIELELLPNNNFVQDTSSIDIARHIVEKLTDLLGRFQGGHKETLSLSLP